MVSDLELWVGMLVRTGTMYLVSAGANETYVFMRENVLTFDKNGVFKEIDGE